MFSKKKFRISLPLAFLIILCGAHLSSAGADPDLVLHYTFDQADRTVKDSSGYDNHGILHGGQYLAALNGRKGIIRFGENSYIDCGDNKSTQICGDFSFSMWVRLNGEINNRSSFIFGESTSSSFWFMFSQYNTLAMYYRYVHPIYGVERLAIPVERSLINYDWNHITVVVEYPRCRFYSNGKLVHDAWMLLPGMGKNFGKSRKYLGGDNRKHDCPLDIDEFSLFRRALSADEVSALAKGQALSSSISHETFIEPRWYQDKVTFRLNIKGLKSSSASALYQVKTLNSKKTLIQKKEIEWSKCTGSPRGISELTLPLHQFVDKASELTITVLNEKGGKIFEKVRPFVLTKPAWVNTKEGYSEKVPLPWTPVKVLKKTEGIIVETWGRQYLFGATPYVKQIITQKKEILHTPITLATAADQKNNLWRHQSTQVISSDNRSCIVRQKFDSDLYDLNIQATVEYDGYIIFKTTMTAKKDNTLEKCILNIPVKKEYAEFAYGDRVYPRPLTPPKPMGMYFSGKIKKPLSFMFSPNIRVTDDEIGLCWQAETDEMWHYKNPLSALEIIPGPQSTAIKANIINQPLAVKQNASREIIFALMALPVKPWLKDAMDFGLIRSEPWGKDFQLPDRKTSSGVPVLQDLVQKGVRQLFYRTACIWPYPMPNGNAWFAQNLKRLVESAHLSGLKVHPYLLHQRYPVIVPEFEYNANMMVKRPILVMKESGFPRGTARPRSLSIENGVPSQATVFITYESQAVQDSYLHSLGQRLDKFNEDGIFLDGTAHLPPGANLELGSGYVDQKGNLHPTFPTFSVRKFMQRLYITIKSRKPDAVIDLHCSFSNNPSGGAYADIFWTGEHWWHLRGKGTKYIAGEFPLDMLRTEFSGRQIGVPVQMIAYRLGTRMKVSATSLLVDTPVRCNNLDNDKLNVNSQSPDLSHFDIMTKVWKIRKAFGISQARKVFFYENQEYVQMMSDDCHTTLFIHPDNKVLAFITNRSPEKKSVKLKLNCKKMGLNWKNLKISDTLYHQEITKLANETITLNLGSEEWTYLLLQSEKKLPGSQRDAGKES